MYRIMIIEDDKTISSLIKRGLDKWGYETKNISDFKSVLKEFNDFKPHLLLLDINLPYYDGFFWCSKIREISKVPIIFISSRDEEADKIRGMVQGGDDYIEKPFSLDILIAKISALLRRAYSYKDANLNTLEHNGVILDIENNTIFSNEKSVRLTHNEAKILIIFMRNINKIVPRYRLIKALWEDESFIDDNTLTVNINRLRKKLKAIGQEHYIETIKGEGYRVV